MVVGLVSGQRNDKPCSCNVKIQAEGLDTTKTYRLRGFGFGGTVSRDRGDDIREHWQIGSGTPVRPNANWVAALGYCGDNRYCLETVQFMLDTSWSDTTVMVLFKMAKRTKPQVPSEQ